MPELSLPSAQPRRLGQQLSFAKLVSFRFEVLFVRGHCAMGLMARKALVFAANCVVFDQPAPHAKTILVTDHLTASLSVRSLAANANRPKSAICFIIK